MNGVIKLRRVHNDLEKPYTTSLKGDLENKISKKYVTLKQKQA